MLCYSKLELIEPELRFLLKPDIPSFRTGLRLRSGERVTFYGLHPEPPAPDEADTSLPRDAELVMVAREVAEADLTAIVAGDLNDVAWSHTSRLFRRISRMLDPRIGRGMFNSFHASYWFLRWPLDHVFVSDDFVLHAIRRLPAFGSDHFPILITLAYAPQGGGGPGSARARCRRPGRGRDKLERVEAQPARRPRERQPTAVARFDAPPASVSRCGVGSVDLSPDALMFYLSFAMKDRRLSLEVHEVELRTLADVAERFGVYLECLKCGRLGALDARRLIARRAGDLTLYEVRRQARCSAASDGRCGCCCAGPRSAASSPGCRVRRAASAATEVAPPPEPVMARDARKLRHLVLVLGDQLDLDAAAFDGFDRDADAVLDGRGGRGVDARPVEHKTSASRSSSRRCATSRGHCASAGCPLHSPRLDDPANRGSFGGEICRPRPTGCGRSGWSMTRARRRRVLAGAVRGRAPTRLRARRARRPPFLRARLASSPHRRGSQQLLLEFFYRADAPRPRRADGRRRAGRRPLELRSRQPRELREGRAGRARAPRCFEPDAITREVHGAGRARASRTSPGRLDSFDYPVTRARGARALRHFIDHRPGAFGR